MSFSYSGDPGDSRLDAIRFATGDTSANEPIMQDAEIEWIVRMNESESRQLAAAFRQCANAFATRPTKRKLGPQEETTADRLKYFKEQADKLERYVSFGTTPPTPNYADEKVFEKGMMENV